MAKLAACLIAVVSALAMAAFAQESPDPSASDKSVEIAGTVVNSATGQPIAGASVVLKAGGQPQRFTVDSNSPEPQPLRQLGERQAVTDEGGRFTFQTVLGYGWSVNVSRRGYRAPGGTQGIATVRGVGTAKPDSLTVKMDPLAAVEGKLVNEDGEPLPSITVELWKIELRDGRRDLRRYATTTTDDLGAYRLWDLSPGSYYLKVAGRRITSLAAADTPQPSQFSEAYGPLYYPSSADMQGAQVIRLAGANRCRPTSMSRRTRRIGSTANSSIRSPADEWRCGCCAAMMRRATTRV